MVSCYKLVTFIFSASIDLLISSISVFDHNSIIASGTLGLDTLILKISIPGAYSLRYFYNSSERRSSKLSNSVNTISV